MKMPRFLIDANLPYHLSIWRGEAFVHVFDLGDDWTDSQIWEYAKKNNLVILSKDSDFSNRILRIKPPPKVVHFKIGNMRIKELHYFVRQHWLEICEVIDQHKLVNVYADRIEGIV